MIVVRVKVPLEQDEYSALLKSAIEDYRDVENQARFIVRNELVKRGLITVSISQKKIDLEKKPFGGE